MAQTLLIVDDHASFRSFARTMLGSDGFDVAGEAQDGADALSECERLQPDVVLLDVGLPGLDGFEVARRIAEYPWPTKVILTSSRAASDYGSQLTTAPVSGFIAKRDLSSDRIAALVG